MATYICPVDESVTSPVGRRSFLWLLGGAAAGILVGDPLSTALQRPTEWLQSIDPTGLADLSPTAPRFRLYTVSGTEPKIAVADYQLAIDGMVDEPQSFSFQDLLDETRTELNRDFQCVTGWRVPDVDWAGVALKALLDRCGQQSGATHVHFGSADGVYSTSLTIDQARRDDVLVVTDMQGEQPVPRRHGGPVRLLVAPMYGYKSLKWLDRITVSDSPDPAGYWEVRGYDTNAWVGTSNGRDDAPT